MVIHRMLHTDSEISIIWLLYLCNAVVYFVIQRFKDLAKDGHTFIDVVHQPNSEVFQLFQDILLLSSGRTVYFGILANYQEVLNDLATQFLLGSKQYISTYVLNS